MCMWLGFISGRVCVCVWLLMWNDCGGICGCGGGGRGGRVRGWPRGSLHHT